MRIMGLAAGEAAARVEDLLLESVGAPEEAARLCAAQWAQQLFPFHSVAARYVCIIAAGDVKLEVREAGLAGLKRPKTGTASFCHASLPLFYGVVHCCCIIAGGDVKVEVREATLTGLKTSKPGVWQVHAAR
jgi:hypothetical protein